MSYIGKSPSFGVRQRYYFTATGGETSLSGADDNSKTLIFSDGEYIDVYLNGVLLVAGTDYVTTTANTISSLAALAASDIVEVVVYDVFSVADTVSASTGGTFNGAVTIDADGTTVLTVDRATSDGTIIDLQKSGSTVGSFDVVGGHPHIASASGYLGIGGGTGSPFMYSYANALYPTTDNYRDLGTSGNRFKDLFLSGGVYLGGTGAANYLDDYEEGTFTPTYILTTTDFGSVTYNVQTGFYRKIGSLVFIMVALRTTAVTVGSGTGSAAIGNLPFTATSTSAASCAPGRYSSWAETPGGARIISGQGYATLVDEGTTGSLTSAAFNTGGNSNFIDFQFFYIAD